jgi:hypothetical protein
MQKTVPRTVRQMMRILRLRSLMMMKMMRIARAIIMILIITTALMSMRLGLTRIHPQGYQVILLHLHLTNSLNFCFSFVLRSVPKVILIGNQALHY